jgi:hypothetical protein
MAYRIDFTIERETAHHILAIVNSYPIVTEYWERVSFPNVNVPLVGIQTSSKLVDLYNRINVADESMAAGDRQQLLEAIEFLHAKLLAHRGGHYRYVVLVWE